MRLVRAAMVFGLGLAWPALADAPSRSIIPMQRPGVAPIEVPAADPVAAPQAEAPPAPVVVQVSASDLAPDASLRPAVRPGRAVPAPPVVAAAPEAPQVPAAEEEREEPRRGGLLALLSGQNRRNQPGATAVRRSLRPALRPAGLAARVQTAAIRGNQGGVVAQAGRGRLCGVRGIEGERLAAIPGQLSGCGISEPVRVSEINGITLSQRPTINCDTARALQDWLTEAVVPEVGRRGGGVNSVRVIASYSCRTRNSQPGARLSEHATGNAVDIAGFGLNDGSEITVLSDWGTGAEGRILRNVHTGACGRFGTVLGPNSDRYHQDHFHLDVASYRSGSYCR